MNKFKKLKHTHTTKGGAIFDIYHHNNTNPHTPIPQPLLYILRVKMMKWKTYTRSVQSLNKIKKIKIETLLTSFYRFDQIT